MAGNLPTLASVLAQVPNSAPSAAPRGLIGPGLSAGVDELQGMGYAAIAAGGRALGLDPVARWGEAGSQRNAQEAAANGRPDLEGMPWNEGGPSLSQVPSWLVYQGAKQVPLLVGSALGAAAGAVAAPEIGLGAAAGAIAGESVPWLARAGAYMPRLLGGAGLSVGEALTPAAVQAGSRWGAQALGMGVAGLPVAAGSMYQEAMSQPGGATREDAVKALALSPLYAAGEAFEHLPVLSALTHGIGGTVLRRAAKASLAGAATEFVTEGVQTAMEQSFRSDLSTQDKAHNIVDGALMGGVMGGFFGGMAGSVGRQHVREAARVDPNALTNDGLTGVIDAAQGAPGGEPEGAAPPPDVPPAPAPAGAQLQPLSDRPLGDVDEDQLLRVHAALQGQMTASPSQSVVEQMRAVQDELQARNLVPPVPQAPAPAPAPVVETSPVPTWEDQAKVLLKGAKNQDLIKAATDEETLASKVHDLLTAQDGRPSTMKVADRLGLVDKDGNPTKRFDDLTAAKASARIGDNLTDQPAAVSPEWEAERTSLLADTRGADVKALQDVPDRAAMEDAVYRGLGAVRGEGAVFGKSEPNVSASMETLARKLELTDDEGNWTKKGEAVAKRQPLDPEDLDTAAKDAAMIGTSAELFKQGAIDAQAGSLTPQATQEAQAAYAAGSKWFQEKSVPAVATAAQSEDLLAKLDRETQEGKQTTTEVGKGESLVASGDQLRMQGLNTRIDETLHPTIHEGDIAHLKRMVQEGAPSADVVGLMNKVAAGQATFAQPAPVPHVFTPASRAEVSGAVERRVLAGQVKSEMSQAQARKQNKAQQRAETARVLQAKAIADELKAAADTQDITAADYVRAKQALAAGDHAKAVKYLPGHASSAAAVSTRDISAVEAAHVEKGLAGKDIHAAGQWLQDNAPNKFYKLVAQMTSAAVKQLEQRHGFRAEFKIVRPGDVLQGDAMKLQRARGVTTVKLDATGRQVSVYLNSHEMGANSGMSYAYALHELIHAATLAAMKLGTDPKLAGTSVGSAVRKLHDVHKAVVAHFNQRVQEAQYGGRPLTEFEWEVRDGLNNALADPEELVTWALTDPEMQAYLDGIQFKGTVSMWDRLVAAIRSLLHIGGNNTALAEVLRSSEELLNLAPSVMDRAYNRVAVAASSEMYGGRRSRLTFGQQTHLQTAMQREGAGQDVGPGSETHQATGWFKAADGEWRFEFSDNEAEFTPAWETVKDTPGAVLGDVLKHSRLFDYYPAARNILVTRVDPWLDIGKTLQGSFDAEKNKLNITTYAVDPIGTILHEVQHYVQTVEDFARGGNPRTALTATTDGQRRALVSQARKNIASLKDDALRQQALYAHLQSSPGAQAYVEAYNAWRAASGTDASTDLYREMYAREMALMEEVTGEKRYSDLAPEVKLQWSSAKWELGRGKLEEKIASLDEDIAQLDQKAAVLSDIQPHDVPTFFEDTPEAYQAYRQLLGEVEARDTAARRDLSAQMRMIITPYVGEDIDPKNYIIDKMDNTSLDETRVEPEDRSVAGSNQLASNFAAQADNARGLISRLLSGTAAPNQRLVTARKYVLEWNTVHHMAEYYGKWFDFAGGNGLKGVEQHLQERSAITARFAQMWTNVRDQYDALLSSKSPSAQEIVRLMQLSEFGLDPTKGWDAQSRTVRESSNSANLKKMLAEGNRMWLALEQRGHDAVYTQLRNVNDVMWLSSLAVSLHHDVALDPALQHSIGGFDVDPVDVFMASPELHSDPAQARRYWSGMVQNQADQIKAYASPRLDITALGKLAPSEATKVQRQLTPLQTRVQRVETALAQMNNAPYFHLGRYGDFFVGFNVAKLEDGSLDRTALGQIADRLEKEGITGLQISPESTRGNVYIRVETADTQQQIAQLVKQLMSDKLVEPDTLTQGKRGDDSANGYVRSEMFDHQVQLIQSDDTLSSDDKERMVGYLRAAQMDMMPENSISRVMTQRDNVPGYSADMMRNFDWRAQVHINALSGMVIAPKLTQDFTQMRAALRDVEHDAAKPSQQRWGMRQVVDEMSQRERDRLVTPSTPGIDQLRALGHTWFLGMSPSYVAVNMTQLGATLWPELTKRYGAMKAAKAMAKATPTAFKILKATFAQARQVSLARASDAVITQAALDAALPNDKALARFIMRVANTGNLDIGGAARELGRSAEGKADSRFDRWTRYASAMGYYSETLTRLIAAISTRELHGGSEDVQVEKAAHVLNESMWNYSRSNQARAVGKSGILGKFSPVVFTFYQYSMQLLEKLYRETHSAFISKSASATEKAEARTFLKAHLAAMTVMAGTLGLPMASVIASVFDRLKDLFDDDDDPSDIKSAYRKWLAGTLGVSAGELVAHGGFRAADIDISSRIGEQDLLPFSRFLTDRRKWDDRLKDAAANTWGAPTSMVSDWAKGASQIADGDILGGMQTAFPQALKGPLKAYQLTEKGYVDKSGNKLPISSPTAYNILMQAMGFNTAPNAEYQEERRAVAQRNDLLRQTSGNIRKELFKAIEGGDTEAAKEWLQRARSYDAENPGVPILPSVVSGLQQRAKARAMASVTNMPLNVNPKDIGVGAVTGYGDY